ncbi:MAG: cation diffusion facilitator family transporter [Candidatus Binatus sp.]
MRRDLLDRSGFARNEHSHPHGDVEGPDAHPVHVNCGGDRHPHVHGALDPTLATTARGIWAIKWSFVALGVAAALQFAVVAASGSVALLADAIHNIGDATTAVPLWVAFLFARRKASSRFTYGYGRVEDLAGALIVMIIFASMVVAVWQAVGRLLHPRPVNHLWALAIAGVIGFIGNEIAAVLRIRVGREMSSAALVADGYHARADGLSSLAVILGAAGVWLGFPLTDPIVGLLIAATILVIVWQSGRAVFTRLLDGVEPQVVVEMHRAAEHVAGVREVIGTRARWLGHRLHAEADIAIDATLSVREGIELADRFKLEVMKHLPALAAVHVGLVENQEAPIVTQEKRRTA